MTEINNKQCVINEDFINFSQYIYLCNFIFIYIDDTIGSMLEDKEVSFIYKSYARKVREYANFNNYVEMFTYIKNRCETDNTIKHIRFRINNAVFCIANRREA